MNNKKLKFEVILMDKGKIKKFAVNARRDLRNSVQVKLAKLGITEDKINDELSISTVDKKYYVDDNENNALIGTQIKWRRDIINELKNRNYDNDPKTAFNDFVEEVAYTWFNRIIALRFMEVNNYLPTRVRVLTSEEGKAEPDIIDEAMEIESNLGGYSDQEKELITNALTDKTPELMDQLYTMLFIKQCDALSEILPGLFEKTRNYLKLLFTPHYDRGVIQNLINEIPEDYFDLSGEGQVQIIGWFYQYYNNDPHWGVINFTGKVIKKDQIPAATQLFTPDWIVRYMVDNSLGKYYLERHPDSSIKSELKYLLPGKLEKIVDDKDITQYKILDNAMGSGHILVYAFDLLMKMYVEQGYSQRDAARQIIENNIFGLEIDKRAFQLSYFSLMMKGREYDRRFFRRAPKINLYYFNDLHVKDCFYDLIDDEKIKKDLKKLVNDFSDATELGSIIKIDKNIDVDAIRSAVENIQIKSGLDVFGYDQMKRHILKTLDIIKIMSAKYEAVVTNPPYMNKFDKTLKKYLRDNYKDYSKDLFSVFIYHNMQLLDEGGYAGFLTPLVWMFISSYQDLRLKIINDYHIDSLIQMEYHAFREITVPVDTMVLKKSTEKIGTYLRLVNFKGGMPVQQRKVLEAIDNPKVGYLYKANQNNFNSIPNHPIAYWITDQALSTFDYQKLGSEIAAVKGLDTCNNKRFVRLWYEVAINKVGKKVKALDETYNFKWYTYCKGGNYRKWYGNTQNVVNWENNGEELRNYRNPDGSLKSRPQNIAFYFKQGITWSTITSSKTSFRIMENSIFGGGGSAMFPNNKEKIEVILGFMNSKVPAFYLNLLNPTLNVLVGDMLKIPFNIKNSDNIIHLVRATTKISKFDWDAFETSSDFKRSPLLTTNASTLQQAYNNWSQEASDRFNQLKSNEEELNKIFIDLYGLQDELTPEEDDKEVSVRKADQVRDIKAFLSYFIGCVFGRYSLDKDGLAYAGGDWNSSNYQTFIPNKDNIILLTDRQYFEDSRDIIVRLKEFLSKTFDPDHLSDNMSFIAQTLDSKKFEKGTNVEQIIRDYFLNDFYKDHSKIYQKRPIYWEFSSGRNKGFKALMYLHCYTPDQLAMVRHYLHDLQPAMNDLINVDQNLLDQETTASAKSKYRKTISTLNKQMAEMVKYDQILDHLSQSPVDLDLDDGVLVNHDKLQQGEKLLSKL